MKILAKQISNLLFEHDCVIVPGLGGFITNYKPAVIHPHNHTFHPPSKQITFNTALNNNDGILINAYAVSLNVDFGTAKKLVEQKVHEIRVSLLKGKRVELEAIGFLSSNKENNIEFTSSNTINYLGEAYGFTRFDFHPVDRTSGTVLKELKKPVVRKTMRWAAILLPIAGLALWTTLNTGNLDRIYGNYASLLPSSNESVTNTTSASVEVKKPTVTKTFTANSNKETVNAPVTDAHTIQSKPEYTTISGSTEVNSASERIKTTSLTPAKSTIHLQTRPNNQDGNSFHIITGAFSVPENAARLAEELKAEGYKASVIGPNRRNLHLVSIQSFTDKESASMRMAELQSKGFASAWLLEKVNH